MHVEEDSQKVACTDLRRIREKSCLLIICIACFTLYYLLLVCGAVSRMSLILSVFVYHHMLY